MFNVYKASSSDDLRDEACGYWMIDGHWPFIVAKCWEDEEDFVQAVMLADYDTPGFTIIEFAEAKQLGKVRVRVDDRDKGDLSAPLGKLYVRNGHAGITYLTGGNSIALLEVPLADAHSIIDGDYGYAWSLECSKTGKRWKTVYWANKRWSSLNGWRPADPEITQYLPNDIEDLQYGLVPPQ